jgi:hypothetical protein
MITFEELVKERLNEAIINKDGKLVHFYGSLLQKYNLKIRTPQLKYHSLILEY